MFSLTFKLLKLSLCNPMTALRLLSLKRILNFIKLILVNNGDTSSYKARYQRIFLDNHENIKPSDFTRNADTKDIFIFPFIDWHYRIQRPQHLALGLPKRNTRIFYLACNPLIALPSCSYAVDAKPSANIIIVQLASGDTKLPDFFIDQITASQIDTYKKSFEALCSDFNVNSPIAIIQHPYWAPLIEELPIDLSIYDCLDFYAGFNNRHQAQLNELETRLIKKADAVTVTSEYLYHHIGNPQKTHIIRNGCEFDKFAQASSFESNDIIRVGYVGAVSTWFDLDMVYAAGLAYPKWQFDIYGRIEGGLTLGETPQNIHFQGEIAYDDVPKTIATFDVGIIPFKINTLTKATNPVKVYEYMAAGKPVVSSALPEVINMKHDDILISHSHTEFMDNLERAVLITQQPTKIKKRQEWAKSQDWALRVDDLYKIIDGHDINI
jgi:glycosyltransferase involved in cell wall biosynthesis